MPSALNLIEVMRRYPNGTQVGPISCDIEKGEFVSILGPSGCGKTTLLRTIAGFEPTDGGRIILSDRDISTLPAHLRGLGLVFQSYALFPHLTVADNIAFGLKLHRTERREIEKRVGEAVEMVGLTQLADRYPDQLSGGQQQRVAIARSIVMRPDLILLDEPLSNLDFQLRLQMREELLRLQRQLGMTFVYVTHDQTEALALSDRVIVLSKGKIAQIGTPFEVYTNPRTRFVADFLGASNLFPVSSLAELGNGRYEAVLPNGKSVQCIVRIAPDMNEPLWISVRPENIRMFPADIIVDGKLPINTMGAHIVRTVFAGDKTEVTLTIDDGRAPAGLNNIVAYGLPAMNRTGNVIIGFDVDHATLVVDA